MSNDAATTPRTIDSLPVHEQIICAIIGVHEGGKWQRKYDKVSFDPNDPGGLSVGWAQAAFQTNSRFLGGLLDRYAAHPQAQYASALGGHLPKLNRYWDGTRQGKRISRAEQADDNLHATLRQMAGDPLWRSLQDERFLEELDKAREIWNARGWTSHLALLACFDQVIQGPQWFLDRVDKILGGGGDNAYTKVLKNGVKDHYGNTWEGFGSEEDWDAGDEEDYVWAWYLLRVDYLMTEGYNDASKRSWPPTTYRCAHILWLAQEGVWDFEWEMPFHTYHPGWYKGRDWSITQDLLAGNIL